jgi:plasmid stabilization system protein ParE
MSGLPLKVAPEAEDDFEAATTWYEKQAPGLANDFAAEIDRALQKIIQNPFRFPLVYRREQVRRVLVVRFPYRVFYTIDVEILVRAILHASQDDWNIRRRFKRS